MRIPTILSAVSLSLLLCFPAPLFAYGDGEGGGSTGGGLSNATTNKIVRTLTKGVKDCQRNEKVYRYDCYRRTYELAAQQMRGNRAYDGARKVIEDVESSLSRTIARNADPAAPILRRGLERYQAIKPAALPAAKREFIAALDQAETKLLRSSGDESAHLQRIAAAINTNKVLLRSALLLAPFALPVTFAALLDARA